jgi:hypothetical protein
MPFVAQPEKALPVLLGRTLGMERGTPSEGDCEGKTEADPVHSADYKPNYHWRLVPRSGGPCGRTLANSSSPD